MFFRSVFSFLATIVTLTYNIEQKELKKNTEFWTRISVLEFQRANHYTIEPTVVQNMLTFC